MSMNRKSIKIFMCSGQVHYPVVTKIPVVCEGESIKGIGIAMENVINTSVICLLSILGYAITNNSTWSPTVDKVITLQPL